MTNFLAESNCNKAMCKTCVFRTDGNQIALSAERIAEIMDYLQSFKSSHVCHVTNKTCYGGLVVQANSLYEIGMIPENTVESMLITAKSILKL